MYSQRLVGMFALDERATKLALVAESIKVILTKFLLADSVSLWFKDGCETADRELWASRSLSRLESCTLQTPSSLVVRFWHRNPPLVIAQHRRFCVHHE